MQAVFNPKVKEKEGKRYIFDPLRQKYVALTPEEGVRQCFVFYLISEKNYPEGLIANEVAIQLNGTSKRCDTVVYDRFMDPVVLVEYKAPTVAITPTVFDQIIRYNMVMHVDYLIVSNGRHHYCCKMNYEKNTYTFIEDIPDYGNL